jgi:hypothetical protein
MGATGQRPDGPDESGDGDELFAADSRFDSDGLAKPGSSLRCGLSWRTALLAWTVASASLWYALILAVGGL